MTSECSRKGPWNVGPLAVQRPRANEYKKGAFSISTSIKGYKGKIE